jgi:hypothetical protein
VYVHRDWYSDAWDHSVGDDVDVHMKIHDDDSMQVEVFSKAGRMTSGIKLAIDLGRDANRDPSARVHATWWSDRGVVGAETESEDVWGEIYVNSISYVQTNPIYMKFCLFTYWVANPQVLMGGLRIKS